MIVTRAIISFARGSSLEKASNPLVRCVAEERERVAGRKKSQLKVQKFKGTEGSLLLSVGKCAVPIRPELRLTTRFGTEGRILAKPIPE